MLERYCLNLSRVHQTLSGAILGSGLTLAFSHFSWDRPLRSLDRIHKYAGMTILNLRIGPYLITFNTHAIGIPRDFPDPPLARSRYRTTNPPQPSERPVT